MNSTVYQLEVIVGQNTYKPTITVADNGIWKIEEHEGLALRLGKDAYADWLIDFWQDRRGL